MSSSERITWNFQSLLALRSGCMNLSEPLEGANRDLKALKAGRVLHGIYLRPASKRDTKWHGMVVTLRPRIMAGLGSRQN